MEIQLFQKAQSTFIQSLSVDFQGPPIDPELRPPQQHGGGPMAPSGDPQPPVWQQHGQHHHHSQHPGPGLPQHGPALHVPHVWMLLHRLLPAPVQERDLPTWKGNDINQYIFIRQFNLHLKWPQLCEYNNAHIEDNVNRLISIVAWFPFNRACIFSLNNFFLHTHPLPDWGSIKFNSIKLFKCYKHFKL